MYLHIACDTHAHTPSRARSPSRSLFFLLPLACPFLFLSLSLANTRTLRCQWRGLWRNPTRARSSLSVSSNRYGMCNELIYMYMSYMYLYMRVCVYICVCVQIIIERIIEQVCHVYWVLIFIYVHVCMYIYIYVDINTYMHTYVYIICIYIYIYIYMYIYIQVITEIYRSSLKVSLNRYVIFIVFSVTWMTCRLACVIIVNGSCHAHESHTNVYVQEFSNAWCREWVMSQWCPESVMSESCRERVMSPMNESCLSWMRHVSHAWDVVNVINYTHELHMNGRVIEPRLLVPRNHY